MAEKGDMDAQHCLGNCCYMGLEVPKDYAKAMEWWKKAAAQGHEIALFHAACAILEGHCKAGSEEAVSLLEKADSMGLRKAKCLLGKLYLYGEHVRQDPEKAMAYLTQAVEEGSVDARTILGAALVLGIGGIPMNRELGMRYVEEAADAGSTEAQTMLSQFSFMMKLQEAMGVLKPPPKKSRRKRAAKRRKKA